eukprot:10968526-Ditylum_brightwellii.AAC.2
MCSSIPFGGVTVLLVGNLAQLPPVKGQTLWSHNSSNAENFRGSNVHRLFTSVVELVDKNRLGRSDPDAVFLMTSFRDSGAGKTQRRIGIS